MDWAKDSGSTMESFLRWTCGPRALAYPAVDVDAAKLLGLDRAQPTRPAAA